MDIIRRSLCLIVTPSHTPSSSSCCPFEVGDSAVEDSSFILAPAGFGVL